VKPGVCPLPSVAEVVIVGGGIQGLALAYNLAELGLGQILVLDAGYFQGGASGRNGTLVRGGFMSDAWTALFSLANRRWIELSKRLRRNVMFSRRGYLMVAERAETAARFDSALTTHAAHGVRSRRVSRRELQQIAPALKAGSVRDAVYLPEGGVSPHHAAMHSYLDACRERGVRIHYATPVSAVLRDSSGVCGVVADGCEIRASVVVIAAGASSNDVARLAGVDLAGYPMRIECSALEPTRPVLRPAIAFIDRLCYVSQTARGEVVGGAEVPERPQVTLASDLPSLTATARVYYDMLPPLSGLRILRQWAGLIQATPDFGPLIGPHPQLTNLWVTAGWSYGYASSAAVGELLAKSIVTGTVDAILRPFAVDRFDRNAPVIEGGIVLAAPPPTVT
jgi:sarcosine oxidase subunit beta